MTAFEPIYTNRLMAALPADGIEPPQQQAPAPQAQYGQEQVDHFHAHLDDIKQTLKKLVELPDHELTLHHLYGAASDLITKNRLTKGKRGATAMEIASELSGPDFPREGPNGEKPTPEQLRKYLIKHFMRYSAMQAQVTHKLAPPSGNPVQVEGEMQ